MTKKKKIKKAAKAAKKEELEIEDVVLDEESSFAEASDDKDEEEYESDGWTEDDIEEEGQLSVDVYQDRDNVIIKSTIAGVEPEDVDVSIDNDMVTIRGRRQKDTTIDENNYFYQECYWGSFSRSIILPVEVKSDEVDATIRNGILTVILPKAKKKDISIKVKDDN